MVIDGPGNPEVTVERFLAKACEDCHSNQKRGIRRRVCRIRRSPQHRRTALRMDIHHPDITLHRRRNGSVNRVRDVVKFGIVENLVDASILKAADDVKARRIDKLQTNLESADGSCHLARQGNCGIR